MSARAGGVISPMLVLEISLLVVALVFFVLLDRYAAGCEHV
jgi:hypothetical protein